MSVRLFKSLLFKSTRIQQEIDREQSKLGPDPWRLIKLKKMRLDIKDRIARLVQIGMAGASHTHLQQARTTHSQTRSFYSH